MKFLINELAPSLNGKKGLMRMHWTRYRRVRDLWTLEFRSQRPAAHKPIDKCTVRIVRYTMQPLLDWDNIYASSKVPLDALKNAGVIEDDTTDCVVDLAVRQVRVARRVEEKTEVVVT